MHGLLIDISFCSDWKSFSSVLELQIFPDSPFDPILQKRQWGPRIIIIIVYT